MRSVRNVYFACATGLTAVTGVAATNDEPYLENTTGSPSYAAGFQTGDPMQAAPNVTGPAVPATIKVSDNEITMRVKAELRATDGLDASGIKVSTTNGVVHLAGSVRSDKDRLTALNTTRSVSGISAVEDEMKVSK